ncbi:NAD(+) synthase [Capnocytophaga gingivalis]|uniref:NAD(+) synthase n=1 Tax=Capnocytophaga gingivalis TaxID=1017 RepID=UPI002354E1FD|nr:NAD(+) synthase [Capnocytophaga gingivalis]
MNTPKVTQQIVEWLKDYLVQTGIKGMVVGISGGIDSAVVSTLCAETGKPVLCLEMPIHQAANQVSRGRNHIAFLKNKYPNVSSLEVDLTPVFDTFVTQVPPVEDNALALANTRARLRMTTLYYFAGLQGYMVVGTGNKIEDFGVGFFTKYGDGGVDVSPIGDLYKSEVYEVGRYLGVLPEILQAAPTDGLFGDDRTDEDQLGATYDELEWAMRLVESGAEETHLTPRQSQVLAIFKRLNKANQHKMVPIPVCRVKNEE